VLLFVFRPQALDSEHSRFCVPPAEHVHSRCAGQPQSSASARLSARIIDIGTSLHHSYSKG